jgi:hypothetical protein
MNSLLATGLRIVGGFLVAGIVLGISVPLVRDDMDAWSVWIVGVASVAAVLWLTRHVR